jgi:hypothetical protein
MQYLTILMRDEDEITTVAGGASNAVFPYSRLGIDALKVYAFEYTIYGKELLSGNANLYMAKSASPIELPFEMNLNYVDLKNARVLDQNNLDRAIQIMSQYDPGDIINAATIDLDTHEEITTKLGSSMNHSKEHLISILSSIAVTLGPVITSEVRWRGQSTMSNQVLITRPTKFVKVDRERAVELISGEQAVFDPFRNRHKQEVVDDSDDEGEFGLGGDWWKDPVEDIRKISRIITDDPDVML